jgi:hypothetical protein
VVVGLRLGSIFYEDGLCSGLLQVGGASALAVQQVRGNGSHGHDVRREHELLAAAAAGEGVMTAEEMSAVFGSILRASRSVQRRHASASRGS